MNMTVRASWLLVVLLLGACGGTQQEPTAAPASEAEATEPEPAEARAGEPTEPADGAAESPTPIEPADGDACESAADCGEGELCAPCCGSQRCVPENALGCLCE
jgi:hypothetical protein